MENRFIRKSLTNTKKCVSRGTHQKKEDTPTMHNDILNLIRIMLLGVLILIGVALGNAAKTETIATESPTVPSKTETPTETPTTESEPHAAPERQTDPKLTYTAAELEMLALVIYQEAGGDACSDETRRMVGTVVMNRIADNRYPNTMQEVITQKAQYGRLYWTGLVWPQRASNPEETHAVQRAYTIAEEILQGVRALPEDVIYQAEFEQGTEVVAYQDGLYFCR